MDDVSDTFTERLLRDAGITDGMSVLDIGCGRGDVSFMAARLIKEQGRVLGIDRDTTSVLAARERVAASGFTNVVFEEGDFSMAPIDDGEFDAVVGRRVLMYQPDVADAIRMLSRVLRPGGLIVFQEHDATIGPVSLAPMPLHVQVRNWIWETVRREGADVNMGFHLESILTDLGFRVEQVRAEAVVETPTQSHPLANIVRLMLSRIVARGVATEAEICLETLHERLTKERVGAKTTYVGELIFGAWARKAREPSS
jgi:ubiquinone/menaquinone biosynthesis C-methylase UbiE